MYFYIPSHLFLSKINEFINFTINKSNSLKKIILLFILFSGFTFAQTSVSGIVKDKDGEPIPFVNVFF